MRFEAYNAAAAEPGIGILAVGCALPASRRRNDDPIFSDALGRNSQEQIFCGVEERRHLTPGEAIEDLMVEASRQALVAARLEVRDVQRLYGTASVSEFVTPNGLFRVHRDLGLDESCRVMPLNCEFTNFIVGCALAWEAGRCGAGPCLVACGSSWTRHVDVRDPHALVVGDGAAAAVVGAGAPWVFLGQASETHSQHYSVMNLRVRAGAPAGFETTPVYEIQTRGREALLTLGRDVPVRLARGLLEQHAVSPREVALVTHQSSPALMEAWQRGIGPAEFPSDFSVLGDMPLSSVPVTLARHLADLTSPYLLLLSPGTGLHFEALLMARRDAA